MKRFIILLSALFIGLSVQVFAEESAHSLYLGTDAAYYPQSDFIAGESHFAPITGPYSGLEARTAFHYDYKLPTPLGDHWLLNSANLVFGSSTEITPVSLREELSVKFTPLPFIVLKAGGSAGSGWTVAGLQGMGEFNGYDSYNPIGLFSGWYLNWFAEGTFQFDTGAIWKGDWTHFQIMYTYGISYEKMTGIDNGELWLWQNSGKRVNGLKNYQTLILAYQMPLVLSRIGVKCDLSDNFDDNAFNPIKYGKYNSTFKKICIAPLTQFTFGKNDSLACVFEFASRRSFKEQHTDENSEQYLTYSGYEWYFNRVAFSWTHTFK